MASLSVKELKKLVTLKTHDDGGGGSRSLSGMDKAELQTLVHDLLGATASSPDEIAELLATTATSSTPTKKKKKPRRTQQHQPQSQHQQQATEFGNMDPDQLRAQARMMRSMTPQQIRMTHPQLAKMSDSQIQAAADQMDMMANNPQMMAMAKEQMSKMTPEQMADLQQGGGGGGGPGLGMPTMPAQNDPQQAAKTIGEMTPEQLRYQATMLRSTDPDTIRRMNPQMAQMTDAQISAAAAQFEMMASNPAMAKMAMEQMKGMTPAQMQAAQQGGMEGAGGMDPTEMFKNMDKTQLKQMLAMVQQNPDSIQQLAASTGISEAQIKQGVDMFANMDDTKMDMALKGIKSVQKMNQVWTTVNTKVGGNLKWLLILMCLVVMGLLINYVAYRYGGGGSSSSSSPTIVPPTIPTTTASFEDPINANDDNEFDEF